MICQTYSFNAKHVFSENIPLKYLRMSLLLYDTDAEVSLCHKFHFARIPMNINLHLNLILVSKAWIL